MTFQRVFNIANFALVNQEETFHPLYTIGVLHHMWGNELLGGHLGSPSTFIHAVGSDSQPNQAKYLKKYLCHPISEVIEGVLTSCGWLLAR